MAKKWQIISTIGKPTGRHETAFVVCGGMFYLIGGREAKGRIDRFDPKTNTWKEMGAKSSLIHHFQPVVVDQKIIMVGAMTGGYPVEEPMSHVQIYDPSKDMWTEGAEIPEARRRGSSGTVYHGGKIYLACGITYGHTSGTNNWFDAYDIQTNTWTVLPEAPCIRDHFHSVVLNDKLYCIGGRNTSYHEENNFQAFFGAVIQEIDVYDFQSQSWTMLTGTARLPIGSAAGGVACLDGQIIYFGGETDAVALADTRSFDPSTNKWTTLAPLNQGRHGSQAITYEGKVYVAAGSPKRGGGNVDSVEVFS
ncbi:MAG: kelch repeat-containing protein [Candidatus Latescibacteria bacterium]|jgi:N-acetylneuraminic acid mutarotase|nr:kelch repeat-containing protein [Candidatus Latescibacterota bacterium]MBT4137670.1 kelch repeat-containing protein [Candidatus Latescibacterota bacterium]MBT5830271.1 kelch repeat-containing protein [Candidatus Latescibacterota bacterium]